mgnify:CR=1 FL=1
MINLTDNFNLNKPAHLDGRVGPWESTGDAVFGVPFDKREIGLTIVVDDGSGAVEYWWKSGLADGDLELKTSGGGGGGVAWGGITGTLSSQSDLQTALNSKEPTITTGTTGQYFRGDKTFQTLDKSAVGLGNVDNTSDANKTFSASQITSGTFASARIPKVIPAVAIVGSAVTAGNTTSEVVLQTLTIPANTLSVGDVIRIVGLYSFTTTGTKTPRVRFGTTTSGTAILSPSGAIGASITCIQVDLMAIVTSSTNLRFVVNNATNALIYGTNTGALTNVTIDRTVSNSFVFTVQKTTGSDTATCETAFLEIITS